MKYTYITIQYGVGDDLMNQLTGGVGGVINSGIGLGIQAIQNQMQRGQNQALTDQQLSANEKLSEFNMDQQYQMWLKTNYPAQVEQLNKAGLNPALLYAKGGPGGTTGSPSGGAGMGIASPGNINGAQNIIAAQEAAADIKLKNAQAENIAAQTPQEADLMKTQIASLNQGIQNQQAQKILTEAQTTLQNLNNTMTSATVDDQIAQIKAAATTIEQQSQQAVRNNFIDANTMNDKIKTIHNIMLGTFLENQLKSKNIQYTQEQINMTVKQMSIMVQNNMKDWDKIGQQNRQLLTEQLKVPQGDGLYNSVEQLLKILF